MEQHQRLPPSKSLKQFEAALRDCGRFPKQHQPLTIYEGAGKPRRLLYFTHDDWCINWMEEGRFPVGWRALTRFGALPESYLSTVYHYAQALGLPVYFVGDLNPAGLATYATLRHARIRVGRAVRRIDVRYLGVDDRWRHLCVSHLKRGESLPDDIPVSPEDMLLLEALRGVLPDLESLIGPQCHARLSSGYAFAFHPAVNPSYYTRPFHDRLIAHLSRAEGK